TWCRGDSISGTSCRAIPTESWIEARFLNYWMEDHEPRQLRRDSNASSAIHCGKVACRRKGHAERTGRRLRLAALWNDRLTRSVGSDDRDSAALPARNRFRGTGPGTTYGRRASLPVCL